MAEEPDAPEEGVYSNGQELMSERQMLERIEAWYDSLSPRDKKKFTDRLWAAVTEGAKDGEQPGARTEAEGALEGPGPDEADRPESDPASPAEVISRTEIMDDHYRHHNQD